MRRGPAWLSLAAFCGTGALVVGVVFGLWTQQVTDLFLVMESAIGSIPAYIVIFVGQMVVPFMVGLTVFSRLTRRPRDEYLRCRKCDHILKGLSEPRCPECGERI